MVRNLRAHDWEDVLRALADRLLRRRCVTAAFSESLIERERLYPTGLDKQVPVALPHTLPEHCQRAALAVATLAEAVPFGAMGGSGRSLPVRLVFLPTVPSLGTEVAWLSRLVDLLRDDGFLSWMLEAESARAIANRLGRELSRSQSEGRTVGVA